MKLDLANPCPVGNEMGPLLLSLSLSLFVPAVFLPGWQSSFTPSVCQSVSQEVGSVITSECVSNAHLVFALTELKDAVPPPPPPPAYFFFPVERARGLS